MPSAVTQNIAVVAASQSPTQLSQLASSAQREAAAANAGNQAVLAVQRVSRAASVSLSAREQQQSTSAQEDLVDGTFKSDTESDERARVKRDTRGSSSGNGRFLDVA